VVEQTNVHAEVNNATNTHPIIPLRLKQAVADSTSPEYQNIMAARMCAILWERTRAASESNARAGRS